MQLAYELGRLEHEILELSPDEYARWVAFLQIKSEETKKASRKGGGGGGGGPSGKTGRRQMKGLG